LADNPAALLALAWHRLAEGRAKRAMVVLPYRDRLVLLSRYLQQLVMESLGKEHDLEGRVVHQGLTVYGNKGSTDQHAYVQQLRDGPDDVFACFVGVLDDGWYGAEDVEPGLDSGDFLQGFLLGTRKALRARGRGAITLLLDQLDAYRLGALVALFERAVGLYAARVGINAYHQPGVEAGKKAAAAVLAIKAPLLAALSDTPEPVDAIAARAGVDDVESAWFLLSRLAANERGVVVERGERPSRDRFARA
jgi:glucose-6-phosphate isomerase